MKRTRKAFTDKHPIQHKVGEEMMDFFPNRLSVLEECAEISRPLVLAMASLMVDSGRMNAAITEDIKDGDMDVRKVTVEAVSTELMAAKQKEREDAINQIFNSLASKKTRILLGRCLMDSLRNEYDYKEVRSAQEVELFLYGDGKEEEGIDLPTFTELITGWLKANSKCFGSMGETLAGLVKEKVSVLRSVSRSGKEETSPANGSSSPTASSQPLDSASPSAS
jgi:hypothetical protein